MVKYKSSQSLDFVFMALANPTRRNILLHLRTGTCSARQLARPFNISLPAISKHLKVLENARLVKREIHGRQHLFTVRPKKLKEALSWVSKFEKFWAEKLDNLEHFLDQEEK